MPLYLGSFRYRSAQKCPGTFKVVCEASNLFSAETGFRKKIRSFFDSRADMWPVTVYLLEYIELSDLSKPTLVLLTREGDPQSSINDRGRSPVFFSALPEQDTGAVVLTEANNGEEEPFLEIGN